MKLKKGSLLVVGIFFLSFGLGSAISNKASATVSPAFYHPNLLGYTVPKALRGTWYFGHKKYPGGAHHFNGLHYHRGKINKYMISRRAVEMSWTLGIDGHKYEAKGYYDGAMVSDLFDNHKKLFWQFNEQYTPVIFEYKGHNHKGIDVSGQVPDDLITRKPTNKYLAFNNWKDNSWGKNTKVKLVKIGW